MPFLARWKNQGLNEAQKSPDRQERKALERETPELEKEFGDYECNDERDRFLPDGNPKTKVANKREHALTPLKFARRRHREKGDHHLQFGLGRRYAECRRSG